MPIYGYRCQSCQREFEVQQRMSDPALAECPHCGAAGTRLFYPAGILFKGSGFYKTDSRSTAAASAPTSDANKTSSDGAGDSSKPATPAKETPATPPTPKTPGPAKPAPTTTD